MKIGLIAMSGVRAYDEELMRLGLTLPGFVERSKVIASLPSLGLLTLAGMTPRHHECVYLEVADLGAAPQLPNDFDLVAISSFTAQVRDAYALADRYRDRGTRVVLGGLHVSVRPDEAIAHADAVVIGEGELTWPMVLKDAEEGRLAGFYRAERQFDLREAPLPDFQRLPIEKYNRLTVQASRGCPLRCDFCAASPLIAPRYNQKPIDRVLAEIDSICRIWPRPFIEFADDNALVNKRYWKKLLPELKRRHVRWFVETDLSLYQDEELLAAMRDSGCAQVLIGLESPTESGLAGIELVCDRKRQWYPEYLAAIEKIQSYGIRVNGCFVLGLDGHDSSIFDDVYNFSIDAELFDVQITIQTPFPGTPLYDRFKSEGRLLHDGQWERWTLFDVTFRPQGMSSDELRAGFHSLAARLYSEELTRWRRANFNERFLHRHIPIQEIET
jgi:radical SAM superfamily enzyme YgiQ (UPF0313 family)